MTFRRWGKAFTQMTQRLPSSLAVGGILWASLERVHTIRFIVEITQSRYARALWRFAESDAAHTILLIAILAASAACWLKIRQISPKRRRPRSKA